MRLVLAFLVCACAGRSVPKAGCARDEECAICHDGSDCGRPARADEARRPGCQQKDTAMCECARAVCASGRCDVAPCR